MANSIRTLTILVFSLLTINLYSNDTGYNLKVHITGLPDATLVLGQYKGSSVFPVDTAFLNNNGDGEFVADKKLPQGIYMIYFEDGRNIDFLLGDDQDFILKTDTANYFHHLRISGSTDAELFLKFSSEILDLQAELRRLQNTLKDTLSPQKKKKIIKAIQDLVNERAQRINTICDKHPDLFVSTFLKATLDIEVPDEIASDAEGRYHYYKANYFNNFDLQDSRLLYTPIFNDKIFTYLDKVIPQIPDSLIAAIDMIIDCSRSDSTYYMYAVSTLFNKYLNNQYMGMDAVWVHIAEKYYFVDSWWASEKFLTELKERVDILKPLLIGKPAPNVQLRYIPDNHFKKAESDTALKRYPHAGSFFSIDDLDADFIVLAFWEANCSHCKKSIPKLYQIYTDSLISMNVKVVAISTLFGEEGKEKWIDFVNQHKMYGWINSWNPYDYQYKIVYDIRSTPQFYILNSRKEIIAKRLGVEQIVDFIKMYQEQNSTGN